VHHIRLCIPVLVYLDSMRNVCVSVQRACHECVCVVVCVPVSQSVQRYSSTVTELTCVTPPGKGRKGGGEGSRPESRRDATGQQLGRFGQKATGLASSGNGQQWICSKGMGHWREIVGPWERGTRVLRGSGYVGHKGESLKQSLWNEPNVHHIITFKVLM
jgi:hypothetical protein